MRFESGGRCGRDREKCVDDNKDKCPFSQVLCVKFDVTFTVDADLDDVDVSCGG